MTSGRLVLDDTDHPRSKSAQALAPLYTQCDQEQAGSIWGPRRVLLWFVTPYMSIPVDVAFYQAAPELSAWDKKAKALKQQGVPTPQRPPMAPTNPAHPPTPPLA